MNNDTPKRTGSKINWPLIGILFTISLLLFGSIYYLTTNDSIIMQTNDETVSNKSFDPEDFRVNGPKTIKAGKINIFLNRLGGLEEIDGFLSDARITAVIVGFVTDIETGEYTVGGINYSYKLMLRSEDGEMFDYYLTDQEAGEAKIFLSEVQGERSIGITDLRRDDVVHITETINLLSDSPNSLVLISVRRGIANTQQP